MLEELARRSGDYALAGLCLVRRKAGHRLTTFSVGSCPELATGAMAALDAGDVDAAVAALRAEIDPPLRYSGQRCVSTSSRRHSVATRRNPSAERLLMDDLFQVKVDIDLTVNGEPVEARVPVSQHLIDFLRLELGLTGAHASCEHGVCGACTVQVDGDAVRGCLVLAAQADGSEIWTHRGAFGPGRNCRSASGVRDAQRPAMWVLHARNVGRGRRIAAERRPAWACQDPGASFGQLLPLHGIRGYRGCGRIRCASPCGRSIMTIQFGNPDRPNSYIGKTRPASECRSSGTGGAAATSTTSSCHAWCMWRSSARPMPMPGSVASIQGRPSKFGGVLRVFDGTDIAEVCTPWVATLDHLKGLKSPPEHALAVDRACWGRGAGRSRRRHQPRGRRRRRSTGRGRLRTRCPWSPT